jgi:beta-galactosidase
VKKAFLFFIVLPFVLNATAQSISSFNQRLVSDWQFIRQDLGGVWEAVRSVKPGNPEAVPIWEEVVLPHCFNGMDAVDPDVNYYQGPGWYRTSLDIKNPYKNGRTLLHFEGAGQKTDVYIGSKKAGSHVGGYDEWTVDITDLVASVQHDTALPKLVDNKIPISIRCDNSRDLEMIPSDLSDFNLYGGLYRYVNLVYVPSVYLKQVQITPSVLKDGENGKVHLLGKFYNPDEKETKLNIKVTDQDNTVAYQSAFYSKGKTFNHEFDLNHIDLWSPENPFLYKIEILSEVEGEQQRFTDQFGFREFYFEKNGPFYLNGKRLLLQGTHRHEDHAGVGAAMTEKMIRQEMQMMKDMGVNFIRLGHYQQSRIVLNLCDSLGILVWEEIPWCRGGLGGETYKEQARRMLTNMITQHRNHPSIIIWGLGNENDWPGDFPEFDKQAIRNFMSELNDLSHQLDASRKTAIRRCDFCKDIVDVYSPSIWAGWYRGKYTEYLEESQKNRAQVDHFLHVEWGGDSHAGRHSESPDVGLSEIQGGNGTDERAGDASLLGGQARVSRDGDWSETYICNLFDWTLKEQEKMPWLTGTAFWIFKDFSTPVRPENPIPYMNQKGVVERDLTPKESYYVFQSYWTTKPMIHIYGHSWPTRWGKQGQKLMVKVYSNCSEVELFLNGKSQGIKKRNVQDFPAAGFHWNVEYKEGVNEIRAVGKSSGEIIYDTISQNYVTYQWRIPKVLDLQLVSIDEKSSWIVARLKDAKGNICLDAKNRVEFCLIGDARLADNQGTATGSRKVELSNGMAKIKVVFDSNRWVASVKTQGIRTAFSSPGANRIETEKHK